MSDSSNPASNEWRVIRSGHGTRTLLSMKDGAWTQRITHLTPANIAGSHPDLVSARNHAAHLLSEDKSSILLIADSSDMVHDTVFDQETQTANRRKAARRDCYIKILMVMLAAFGFYLCFRELPIPLCSPLGLTCIGIATLILVFFSLWTNPIELGIQLLILVLLAWFVTQSSLKALNIKKSPIHTEHHIEG